MAAPTVTGFAGKQPLPNNLLGLSGSAGTTSPCEVSGSNMAIGNTVNATSSGYSWSGAISAAVPNVTSTWAVNMVCSAAPPPPKPGRSTQEVTVTVANGDGTSPGYQVSVPVGADR
jgi:hypothetical protein